MSARFNPKYENPRNDALAQTLIISARSGYSIDGLKDLGYIVIRPYRDRGIVERFLREAWFRLGLPEDIWYSNLGGLCPRDIIVHDPLVTSGYLLHLVRMFPDARIHFLYWNLVGNAKHLLPSELPASVHGWTYDRGDAEKHGLNYVQTLGYPTMFMCEKEEASIDLFFVGSDKGRADDILALQSELGELGLTTDFRIMPNGRFSRRKSFYSRPMSYAEISSIVARTKGILNICMAGQSGATLRDYESIFNQVKLITNNQHARSFFFYRPENVFILGEEPLSDLPAFLETPFSPIDQKTLKQCALNAHIDQIVQAEF